MLSRINFFLFFSLFSVAVISQVTKIPQAAKDNFANQYPGAQSVNWSNDVINVNVKFELNGEKLNAEYNNKGIWRKTEKSWTYDRLPEIVRDGFVKSKYADRGVTETVIVYYPGDVEQYRLKVEKNQLQKKYLFFNKNGRLVRDAITL